jgi:hypothetical protein
MSSPRVTTVLLPPAKGRSIGGDGVDPPHGKCPWGQAGTTKLGKIRRPQMGRIQRPLTAASKDCDVLEHRLAAVAEARSFHPCDLEAAPQLVDHEGCERLALYMLSNDEQWLARLYHCFQQRQQLLQSRELLFVNKDIRVFHIDPHLLGIGDKVG